MSQAIKNDTDFLKEVMTQKYLSSINLQQRLVNYVFNNPSIDKIKILWLISQNHNLSFTPYLLEESYLCRASIDELIEALDLFLYKPASFIERVFSEGTTEQIQKMQSILKDSSSE